MNNEFQLLGHISVKAVPINHNKKNCILSLVSGAQKWCTHLSTLAKTVLIFFLTEFAEKCLFRQ